MSDGNLEGKRILRSFRAKVEDNADEGNGISNRLDVIHKQPAFDISQKRITINVEEEIPSDDDDEVRYLQKSLEKRFQRHTVQVRIQWVLKKLDEINKQKKITEDFDIETMEFETVELLFKYLYKYQNKLFQEFFDSSDKVILDAQELHLAIIKALYLEDAVQNKTIIQERLDVLYETYMYDLEAYRFALKRQFPHLYNAAKVLNKSELSEHSTQNTKRRLKVEHQLPQEKTIKKKNDKKSQKYQQKSQLKPSQPSDDNQISNLNQSESSNKDETTSLLEKKQINKKRKHDTPIISFSEEGRDIDFSNSEKQQQLQNPIFMRLINQPNLNTESEGFQKDTRIRIDSIDKGNPNNQESEVPYEIQKETNEIQDNSEQLNDQFGDTNYQLNEDLIRDHNQKELFQGDQPKQKQSNLQYHCSSQQAALLNIEDQDTHLNGGYQEIYNNAEGQIQCCPLDWMRRREISMLKDELRNLTSIVKQLEISVQELKSNIEKKDDRITDFLKNNVTKLSEHNMQLDDALFKSQLKQNFKH